MRCSKTRQTADRVRVRVRDFGEVHNARLSPATNITYCPLRSGRQRCSPTTPFPEIGLLKLLFVRLQRRTAEREFTGYLPVYPLGISVAMVFDATRVDTTRPKLSTNLNGWLLVAWLPGCRVTSAETRNSRNRDVRRHIDMSRTTEFDHGLKHDFS